MSTSTVARAELAADHQSTAAMHATIPTPIVPTVALWLRYCGERATVLAIDRKSCVEVPVGILNPSGRGTGNISREVLADGALITAAPRLLAAVLTLRSEETVQWDVVRAADRAVRSWWDRRPRAGWYLAPNRLIGERREPSRANSLEPRFGVDTDAPTPLVYLIAAAPLLALAVRAALGWEGKPYPFSVQVVDDALEAAVHGPSERAYRRYRFEDYGADE